MCVYERLVDFTRRDLKSLIYPFEELVAARGHSSFFEIFRRAFEESLAALLPQFLRASSSTKDVWRRDIFAVDAVNDGSRGVTLY